MGFRPGRFLITGCSGGGKSTLLAELAARGLATVAEPGRRIVAAETASDSPRLPWNDPADFARTALGMAQADFLGAAGMDGPVFFDRGVLDARVALDHAAGRAFEPASLDPWRYDAPVFLAPPWPELFRSDGVRRHDLAAAEAEFRRIEAALARLGWSFLTLPRVPVEERADRVLAALETPGIG